MFFVINVENTHHNQPDFIRSISFHGIWIGGFYPICAHFSLVNVQFQFVFAWISKIKQEIHRNQKSLYGFFLFLIGTSSGRNEISTRKTTPTDSGNTNSWMPLTWIFVCVFLCIMFIEWCIFVCVYIYVRLNMSNFIWMKSTFQCDDLNCGKFCHHLKSSLI